MNNLDYILFDLHRVREHRLIEQALELDREKPNRDDKTTFTWITLAELAQAGAIIDIELDLPLRLALATPEWYQRHCDRLSRAVWRKELTDEEATFQLDFYHQICWRLPWPEGWARGRIRSLEGAT